MRGFRMNAHTDASITRSEWDRIGRQYMITDEIYRVLGMAQGVEETRGDTRVAQASMFEDRRK